MFSVKAVLTTFGVVAAILICRIEAGSIDTGNGTYKANWTVANSTITVVVTAKTLGYIGFGINSIPTMLGADLFIGGVANGSTYGSDYHGIGNTLPVLDKIQDYTVISGAENAADNTTTISFSRPLVTGDEADDTSIINAEQWVLWSIGSTDSIAHHAARGTVQLNILA